jgi:Ca-activated chloride channel family protein
VKFLWPEMLAMLVVVPGLIAWYVMLLRRRKKNALRYASLSIVKEALSASHNVRRHVPPALLLLSLTTLVFAISRPVATITLPTQHDTVILAMDVSGSMRAADVLPSRFEAMQAAAKAFIAEQPRSTRIGIVSFAGAAALVQPPTRSKEDLLAAIDRFQMQRGTAIGSGIIVSLAALFPDAGIDISSLGYGGYARRGYSLDQAREPEKKDFTPVPPGSYNAAAIILLTDGQRTTGPDSLDAAKMAADRGVRIFTVGIGTIAGDTIGYEGWSMRVRLDEETLKQIANVTRGEYFYAADAADLLKVYKMLNFKLVLEKKETEITALLSAFAAVTMLVAASLSLLWFNRII